MGQGISVGQPSLRLEATDTLSEGLSYEVVHAGCPKIELS